MKTIIQLEIDFIKRKKNKGEYIDTITLEGKIKERRFTVKDIGVNYRWIDHWNDKGLLLGNYKEHLWKKFNLVEYVWLKLIVKMREFNIGLETVRKVKEILDYNFTIDEFLKTNSDTFLEVISGFSSSDQIVATRNLLEEDKIPESIKESKLNLLEVFLMDILTLYSYYSILIDTNGEVIPVKYSYLELYSDKIEFKDFVTKAYVSISITEILKDYIIEKDVDLNYGKRLAILSEEESLILKTIRQDDLKSVLIKFGKNRKINLLEEIKEKKIDKASRLFELIMAKGYQDITIKTQNGEIVYCENKTKKMI